MHEKRDWLVLSLKRSKDDWLVWYRTASAGYTSSLILAGRYTEAEARANQVEGQTLAVSLSSAVELVAGHMVLRNNSRTIKFLKGHSK